MSDRSSSLNDLPKWPIFYKKIVLAAPKLDVAAEDSGQLQTIAERFKTLYPEPDNLAKQHGPAIDKLAHTVLALDQQLRSCGEPFAGLSPERYAETRSDAHAAIVGQCYDASIAELVTMLLGASNYLGERLAEALEAEAGR